MKALNGSPNGRSSNRRRVFPVAGLALALAVNLTNCAWASDPPAANADAPTTSAPATAAPRALVLKVTKTLPHEASCFTEGFQWTSTVTGGGFYESCGQTGASTIRITNTKGKVLKQVAVPGKAFAEGTVRLGNLLYQLTWRERLVFVRNPTTLALLETRSLPDGIAEGWGMTSIGRALVISDGTSAVHFLDPTTWKVTRSVTVLDTGRPVDQLNELETIGARLWINVWRTETILVVDPTSGVVTARISMAGLRPPSTLKDAESVANGIAYDPKTGRIFVTGKNWPVTYQVTTAAA